jgi:hypothetical protein
MPSDPYQTTLPTVAAGRAAVVARLRALATRIDELPLDVAAEVLILIEPAWRRSSATPPSHLNAHPLGVADSRASAARTAIPS